MRRDYCTLSILIEGDEPPREFRIFAAGKNSTRKGPVLFDADAAKRVMAAYAQHGADIMLDLEHLSLDDTHPNYDPDARGWCQLELRNGELWAVNVRWTPDGAERLKDKKQRYISPAFIRDAKSGRVVELINVALCGMPATDKLTPLVAATDKGVTMRDQICKALGLSPDATDEQVVAALNALVAKTEEMTKKLSAPSGDAPKDEKAMMSLLSRLTDKVVSLENGSRVRELVAANRRKFASPAQEQWALKQTPEALEAFIASAPDLPETARYTEKKKDPAAKEEAVTLTEAEREVCRLTGQDEAALVAHKTKLAKGAVN